MSHSQCHKTLMSLSLDFDFVRQIQHVAHAHKQRELHNKLVCNSLPPREPSIQRVHTAWEAKQAKGKHVTPIAW
jgi:predicted transcriptional regulator